MDSKKAAKKAKVTLILEDMTSPDGREGMSVDIVVDPEITDEEELTAAQAWASLIIEMIYEASAEVVVESENGGDLEVVKGGTSDGSKTDPELH